MIKLIELNDHVFVTKLAGFEHSEYIQKNETRERKNEDDIPLVQGKNIRNGFFVYKHDWYIPKEISDKLERSKLNKDCILVPYVGSNLGEVGIFYHKYDCHMASNIAKIELIDDYFDIEFLKYYLQSPLGQKYLFQAKQGSAQPNITMESIRKTKIIDIPFEKQKEIVGLIKPLEDKLLNDYEIRNQLEAMIKDIYSYWFLQFNYPDNSGRPYKENGGSMRFCSELLMNIPSSFKVLKLKDVCKLSLGGTPSRDEPSYWECGTINWLNSGEIANFPIVESAERITDAGLNNSATELLPAGTTVISITGNIRVSVLGIDSCANQSVVGVLERETIKKEYLYPYLTSLIEKFLVVSTGNCQQHINKKTLEESLILIPPTSVLESFYKITEPIMNLLMNKAFEDRDVNKLKNTILPNLITGKIHCK